MPNLNFQAQIDLTSFNKAIATMVEGLNIAQKRITDITNQTGQQAEKVFKAVKIDPTGITSPLNNVINVLGQIGQQIDIVNKKGSQIRWSGAFDIDKDVRQASTSLNLLIRTLFTMGDTMDSIGRRMQTKRFISKQVIDEDGKTIQQLTKELKNLERAYDTAQKASLKQPSNAGFKDEMQAVRSIIRATETDITSLQNKMRSIQSVGGVLQNQATQVTRYAAAIQEGYSSVLEIGKRGQATPIAPAIQAAVTPKAVLPSLAQETGQTYVQAFIKSLYNFEETFQNQMRGTLKEVSKRMTAGVDMASGEISPAAMTVATDKVIIRLKAGMKAVANLVTSPDVLRTVEMMSTGEKPPEALIQKIGASFNKVTQYLWKQVDAYAAEIGEGRVESARVTGKISTEETRAKLLPEIRKSSLEINRLEKEGVDLWGEKIAKLRAYRQELVNVLRFSQEHGGITGVSAAARTGPEYTIGPKLKTTVQTPLIDANEMERTLEKILGLESRVSTEEEGITQTVKRRDSISGGAYANLQRTVAVLEHMRSLWVGMTTEPGRELSSMLQAAQQLEALIGRSTKIGAFDPEVIKVVNSLPLAFGKTAGYVQREIPTGMSETSALLQETKTNLMGLPEAVRAPFTSQIEALGGLDKQIRSISYKSIETQIARVQTLMGEAITDPQTKLPQLYSAIGKLNTLLENTSHISAQVREKAVSMFESVNLGPIIEKFGQLESLWTAPKGKTVAGELDTQMKTMFGSYKETGPEKPIRDLLTLWKQVYEVVKQYHVELGKATKAGVDTAPITKKFGAQFDQAVGALNMGFQGAKEPITVMNSIGEAALKASYNARDLFNVGINATGLLENSRRLALLTHQAVAGTLPSEYKTEFDSMRKSIEGATMVVQSEHLPALKTVLSTVTSLEATTRKYAGGSLLRSPRGLLPEWLHEQYGLRSAESPFSFGGFSLEQAGTGVGSEVFQHGKPMQISPMARYFEKVNDEIGEYFQVIGAQLKPTAAQVGLPGSLEFVDTGLKRIQGSVVRSLEWTIGQLSKHEMPVQMFEPTVTEYFPKLIERLTAAQKVTGFGTAEGRPEVASLGLTLGNTKRQLEVVQTLYRELFTIVKSGKPVSDELFQSMEQKALKLSKTFESKLIQDTRKLIDSLRQFIRFGEAVPGAIQEALKLPSMVDKKPSGIIEMLGGKVAGGKSFLETLDPTALMRVEMGLSEARAHTLANVQRPDVQEGILKKIEWSRRLLGAQIARTPETAWPKDLYEQLSPEMQKTVGTALTGITKEKVGPAAGSFAQVTAEATQFEAAAKKASEVVSAEKQIPSQIDAITTQKLAALQNQRKGMAAEIEKTAKTVKEEVQKVKPAIDPRMWNVEEQAEMASAHRVQTAPTQKSAEDVMNDVLGLGETATRGGRTKLGVGKGAEGDVTNMLQTLKNRLAELSQQYEVFGHAVSSTGSPVSTFVKGMQDISHMVNFVIKDMATMGGVAPTFDAMITKFNESAVPGTQVKTIGEHWTDIEELRGKISTNRQTYLAARQARSVDLVDTPAGSLPAYETMANAQKEYIALTEQLKVKRQELNATMDIFLSKEVMAQELFNREITTIEQLGSSYVMLKAAAETGVGARSQRTAHLAPLQEAERIARETLVSSAWGRAGEGSELFKNLEAPAMTPADVLSKVFPTGKGASPIATFATEFGEGAAKIAEIYQRLNESLRLGVQFPKIDEGFAQRANVLARDIAKIDKLIETNGPSAALNEDRHRIEAILQQETEAFLNSGLFGAIEKTYRKISTESEKLRGQEVGIKFADKMRKSADEVTGMSTELKSLTETFKKFKTEGAGTELKIPAYEAGAEAIAKARQILFQAQRDSHVPKESLAGLSGDIKEAQAAQKGMLSLWERLTNTIKTSRNTMADLFMYQVRWYSSMMVFFAIFNKITGLFTEMMQAQFEIERATVNLRESSGEVVTNFDRLQKIAQPAIFEGMIKWGYTAKDASEALYQLGSAGLTAREALAALGPSLAMVLGTTADMRESVKTLAGLYNVLSSSMTPLDAVSKSVGLSTTAEASAIASAADQGAKFRNIADVLTMVFRDHQVEMNELNRGYQFAISASDMAGLSFEQLSAILAILNDNMIKSSRAGRGVTDILMRLSKDPYAVLGSFKQMALGMEKSLDIKEYSAANRAEVKKLVDSWDFSKLKDKSMFEVMGELSKMVNATGISIGVLSRILENFGVIGGRSVAPMLKHWFDIERETIRLSISASGAAEMMADRMSDTMEKGLLKVSAYFQRMFYEVFQVLHISSKEFLNVFASLGDAASSAGRSLSTSAGGGFFGGFMQGAVTATPAVLTLASIFSMLGGVLPRIGAIFPNLGLKILFWVGTLVTAIPVLKEVTFLQNLFTASIPGGGLLKLAIGLLTVVGAFGLVTAAYKRFFEDSDSLIAQSETTWAEYSSVVSKGAQKQKEAWTQANYIRDTRKVLAESLEGLKDNAVVTDDLHKKFRLYAVSVGATEAVEKRRALTVGEMKEAIKGLREEEEKALKTAQETSLRAVSTTESEKLYAKAVEETIAALQKVREELEKIKQLKKEAAEGTTVTGALGEPLPVPPSSPAVQKRLEVQQKGLEWTLESQTEDLRKKARENLLNSVTSLFGGDVTAEIQREASFNGERGAAAVLKAFSKAIEDVKSLKKGKEVWAIELFPTLKDQPEKAVEQFDKMVTQFAEAGSVAQQTLFAKLAKTGTLPLGNQLAKEAMEKVHNDNMKRLQDEINLTERQVQLNQARIVQIQQTKVPNWDEVDQLMSVNNALQKKRDIQEKSRIDEELSYKQSLLIKGTSTYESATAQINAERAARLKDVEVKQQTTLNTQQKEYQQLITQWFERELPRLRDKQLGFSLQPGGTFGVTPGAGAETTSQILDAMKPRSGVTKEKLQEILNILTQQMAQFGFGPEVAKIFTALIAHESQFVEGAIGPETKYGRARGLLQILPSNLTSLGVNEKDWYDAKSNITAGVRMLADLDAQFSLGLRDFKSKSPADQQRIVETVVSAWSAGPNRVKQAMARGGLIPNIAETQNEVADVTRRWRLLSGIVLGSGEAVGQDLDKLVIELMKKMTTPGKGGTQPLPAEQQKEIWKKMTEFISTTLGGIEKLSPNVKAAWIKLGVDVGVTTHDAITVMNANIQKELEAGHLVPLTSIDKYFEGLAAQITTSSNKQFGAKQMREKGVSFLQAMLQQDFLWKPDMFDQTAAQMLRIADLAGVTRTKLYNMITTGLNPEVMKEVLRGNENLTVGFYDKFISVFERAGMVPTKLYNLWEAAILEMLQIGDVFTEKTLQNWAEILKKNPVKKLGEDAGAFAKYFALLAARQDIKTSDLQLMSNLMHQFGATTDEVWKAFGDVADQQIRRIRASWYEAGTGIKNDLKESATLGDAFWWAMTKGLADFGSKIRDPFKMLADSISGVLETFRSTMEEMFTDIGMHAPKTWQEYQNKIAEGFTKIGSKNLSEQVMGGFTDLIGSAMGLSPDLMEKMGLKKSTAQQRTAEDAKLTAAAATEMNMTLKSMVPPAEQTAAATSSMDAKMGGSIGSAEESSLLGTSSIPADIEKELYGTSTSPSTSTGAAEAQAGGFNFANIPVVGPIFSLVKSLFGGLGFRHGGIVPGFGFGDIVPAVLEPGEAVIPRHIVRKFQEGGEAFLPESFDPEDIQSLIGNMIGEQLAPFKEAATESTSKFAGIGEGDYGPAFGRQLGFQQYLDQAYAMDNARKLNEWNAKTQQYVQEFMHEPTLGGTLMQMGMSTLKMVGGMGGMLAQGGLVPHFAVGGLLSTQDESSKPWLYGHPSTISIDETKKTSTPWWQSALSYAGPLLGVLSMFSGKGGKDKSLSGGLPGIGQSIIPADIEKELYGTSIGAGGGGSAFGGIGDFFSGIGGWFSGLFAKGGLVPPWAPKFGTGAPVNLEKYFPTSGVGSSSAANVTVSQSGTTTQGSYWPSLIMGMLPLLFILQKYGLGAKKSPTPSTSGIGQSTIPADIEKELYGATSGASDPGILSKVWSGIKSIFGYADGGYIDLQDIIPQISKNWEAQLTSNDVNTQLIATEAQRGVTDVVSFFQKNNPAALSTIAKVIGTSPTFSGESEGVARDSVRGGFYSPATDKIVLDLKESYADPSRIRGDYASALTHEIVHDLSKTGRPLAGWLQQVDSSKVGAYLKQQGITDPEELAYLQSPHETIARGVAHHIMRQIGTPGFKGAATWPEEYDPMMQELAKGMSSGKYPQAPDQGLIKNLMWKLWGKPIGFAGGDLVEFLQKSRPETGKGLIWDEVASQRVDSIGSTWDSISSWFTSLFSAGSGLPRTGPWSREGTPPTPEEFAAWQKRQGKGFASGDQVPGLGSGDTVPAWLTPGEFVVNKGTVGFFGPDFFHGLQDMARQQKSDSIAQVASAANQAQKFARGGVVKTGPAATTSTAGGETSGASMSGSSASAPDIKMTMVTVVDESSLDQFLNTKKYGDVLVNKLGSRISRRMSGGRAL